jgi:hypothetical protein
MRQQESVLQDLIATTDELTDPGCILRPRSLAHAQIRFAPIEQASELFCSS